MLQRKYASEGNRVFGSLAVAAPLLSDGVLHFPESVKKMLASAVLGQVAVGGDTLVLYAVNGAVR